MSIGGPLLAAALMEAFFTAAELIRLQIQMQKQGGDASQEQVDAAKTRAHDAGRGWDAAPNPNED